MPDRDQRPLLVTYHPSAVLRADDRAVELRRALVDDLGTAGAQTALSSNTPRASIARLTRLQAIPRNRFLTSSVANSSVSGWFGNSHRW